MVDKVKGSATVFDQVPGKFISDEVKVNAVFEVCFQAVEHRGETAGTVHDRTDQLVARLVEAVVADHCIGAAAGLFPEFEVHGGGGFSPFDEDAPMGVISSTRTGVLTWYISHSQVRLLPGSSLPSDLVNQKWVVRAGSANAS